ncbi:pyridoxal phosphate-dependent aminotransferase [Leptospira noguchii]|uniref:pyridoxal phosphate-dependent aminotransferase n=1 Tax=Leptospira noguchii TaxID=28182 RepID=UPI0002BEB2E4|nr:pyridoxal phosphate-dependent aminotransferase [Leptospira noguchii]EMO29506.1 aminotransferase, class I/II [Leptospira interrogans serovar Bataviae str. HAI135]UOG29247.1 pyridoxal phosphate-dependent aminotransferase [Leptospira noguchii]
MKPSASIEIDKKAKILRQSGRKIISLGIGDPHFPPPKVILDSLTNLPDAHSHYSDSSGLEILKEKIAFQYGGFNKNNILITPGVKQGLYYLLEVIKPKKLCVLEPAWLGYNGLADYLNIPTHIINLNLKSWKDDLKKAEFDCLILCSPNNPTGKIFSEEETDFIIEISKLKNAFIVADEIYIYYSYRKSVSFSNFAKEKDSKIIILNGFSKSHAVTGYRVGYIVSSDTEILRSAELLQQNTATCTSTLSQYALIDFDKCSESLNEYYNYYLINRNLVAKELSLSQELVPDGGFYYFLDLSHWGILDSDRFCSRLLDSTGLVLIPGSSYGSDLNSFIRLSFCLDRDLLMEGLFLLKGALKEKSNE